MKMRSMAFAAHLAIAWVVQSAVTHACSFENPQAVALGTLNLIYPDAVHVLAAVWRAGIGSSRAGDHRRISRVPMIELQAKPTIFLARRSHTRRKMNRVSKT